jgi:probable rRNA maturation factor
VPVRIVIEGGPHPGVSRADVTRRARAMLRALQMPDTELSIVLTGDNQIQNLNRIYRKKDRPTDVLAFALREGEYGDRAGRLLGDVVVSVPTARRQATARGRPLGAELTMLLAHGLLHLLGWDHDTPAKDRRMRRETDRLCLAADAAAGARPARRPMGGRVKGETRERPNADSAPAPRRRGRRNG